MNVLDLFSGIGGFSLGLERAGGFETVAFCENDPKCIAVLNRHWPDVPVFADCHELTPDAGFADIVTGGFPCQPFSTAARGRNNAADLWPEFIRIIRAARPSWVIAENVPGLGSEGIERVCSDLEGAGFSVWPFDFDTAIPERQRGRLRALFVAHANGNGKPRRAQHAQMARLCALPSRREPNIPAPVGVDDGLPGRMDRLHMLGNSVSPWAVELIGRAIMRVEVSHV